MAKSSFNERANFLAQEYWKARGRTSSRVDEKSRLREIEGLLGKGLSGKLAAQLEKEASDLRRVIEQKRTASGNIGSIRRDLLELVSDFAPSLDLRQGSLFPYDQEREPLSEEYFRAITDLFFGSPKIALELKRATLSPRGIQVSDADDDFAALGSLNYVTLLLQEAAKKMLGRENLFDRVWKRVKERDYATQAMAVLVENGQPLSVERIRESLNASDQEYRQLVQESYDRGLADDLEYMMGGEWEQSPLEKRGGRYEVTDFGRWMWHFCKEMEERGGVPVDADGPSRVGRLFSRR